jgi:hypothetical protein
MQRKSPLSRSLHSNGRTLRRQRNKVLQVLRKEFVKKGTKSIHFGGTEEWRKMNSNGPFSHFQDFGFMSDLETNENMAYSDLCFTGLICLPRIDCSEERVKAGN